MYMYKKIRNGQSVVSYLREGGASDASSRSWNKIVFPRVLRRAFGATRGMNFANNSAD